MVYRVFFFWQELMAWHETKGVRAWAEANGLMTKCTLL